jgi:hypothetical protein
VITAIQGDKVLPDARLPVCVERNIVRIARLGMTIRGILQSE